MRCNNGDTTLSSTTGWDTLTTPYTFHASNTQGIPGTAIYTQAFTAPNTTNACTGGMIYLTSTGYWTGGTLTVEISLEEYNGASWVNKGAAGAKASVTVNTSTSANFTLNGRIYARFTTPYVYTTTTASYYRLKVIRDAAGVTTNPTCFSDSGGANPWYAITDDRTGAVAATDDIYIAGQNGTTKTVTLDGTASIGSGGSTTFLANGRVNTNAMTICDYGVAVADTAANVTITYKGQVMGEARGQFQVGSSGTPYPAAKKFIFQSNPTADGDYGIHYSEPFQILCYGAPKPNTSTWKVHYASNSGLTITTDVNHGWSAGDEGVLAATSNSATNYNECEGFTVASVPAANQLTITPNNKALNPGFEFAGGGGADIWLGWTETAGTGALADETVTVHGGGHAAKVTAGSSTNTTITQTMPVGGGVQYTFSFWTQGTGTRAGRYFIYDATNASYIQALTTTGVTGAAYAQVTNTFTTAANCISVQIGFQCSSTNGDVVYFDDASFANDAGLQYVHTTDAYILNVGRNVVFGSNHPARATYFYNVSSGGITTAGHQIFQWCELNELGLSTATGASPKWGGTFETTANQLVVMDYSVFKRIGAYAAYIAGTLAETYTGVICYSAPYSRGISGLTMQGGKNKTFVDCFAIDLYTSGFNTYSTACTWTRCIGIACNKINNTVNGAFYNQLTTKATFNQCEAHACGKQGVYISSTTQNIWYQPLFGTKGTNGVSEFIIASGAYFDTLLMTATSGSAALVAAYLLGSDGAMMKWDTLNGVANNHIWFTNYGSARSTGAGLTDTLVRTTGSNNVRLAPEDNTTGINWSFLIPATKNTTVSFQGYFLKNVAMGTSTCKVELFLPGSTTADATTTLSNNTSNTWTGSAVQSVALSAYYSGAVDSFATIKVTAISATASAYLYAADFYNSGDTTTLYDKLAGLTIWYNAQPSPIITALNLGGIAPSVWAVATSGLLSAPGTTGAKLGNLKNPSLLLGGTVIT